MVKLMIRLSYHKTKGGHTLHHFREYLNKQLQGSEKRHTLSKRQSARKFLLSPTGDGTAILRGVSSDAKV